MVRIDFYLIHSRKNKKIKKNPTQQFYYLSCSKSNSDIFTDLFMTPCFILCFRSLEELDNKANVARNSTGVTDPQNAQSFENSLYFEMNQQKKDSGNSKVNFKAMP